MLNASQKLGMQISKLNPGERQNRKNTTMPLLFLSWCLVLL